MGAEDSAPNISPNNEKQLSSRDDSERESSAEREGSTQCRKKRRGNRTACFIIEEGLWLWWIMARGDLLIMQYLYRMGMSCLDWTGRAWPSSGLLPAAVQLCSHSNAIHRLVSCIPPDTPDETSPHDEMWQKNEAMWGGRVNKRKIERWIKTEIITGGNCVAGKRVTQQGGPSLSCGSTTTSKIKGVFPHPSAVHLFLINLHPSPKPRFVPQLSVYSQMIGSHAQIYANAKNAKRQNAPKNDHFQSFN